MAKLEIAAGVDLGSSQIVCVIGRKHELGKIEILGSSRVPCRGIKGGVVVNINETIESITNSVEMAEEKSNEEIHSVYIAIRGAHIDTFNHRGAIKISRTDKEITQDDIEAVIESAKIIQISPDREIIHIIPQDFSIDRQSGIVNPLGMEGGHLSVDVHIIAASTSHLDNIYKCFNRAGFEIEELMLGVLAAGETAVSNEEKDLGVLLVDMGGDTVNLAIYRGGEAHYTHELPFGGEAVTRDLAHGLRSSFAMAREIKEKYGVAINSLMESPEEITYLSVDGRTQHKISQRTLVDIIQPRIEEIFTMLGEEVRNSGYGEDIPVGAVLTGGSSLLKGIAQAASSILNIPVRLGAAHDITGPEEIVSNPSYTAALGLLEHSFKGKISQMARSSKKPSVVKKVRSWFEHTF